MNDLYSKDTVPTLDEEEITVKDLSRATVLTNTSENELPLFIRVCNTDTGKHERYLRLNVLPSELQDVIRSIVGRTFSTPPILDAIDILKNSVNNIAEKKEKELKKIEDSLKCFKKLTNV